jgi:hypothetical protein
MSDQKKTKRIAYCYICSKIIDDLTELTFRKEYDGVRVANENCPYCHCSGCVFIPTEGKQPISAKWFDLPHNGIGLKTETFRRHSDPPIASSSQMAFRSALDLLYFCRELLFTVTSKDTVIFPVNEGNFKKELYDIKDIVEHYFASN